MELFFIIILILFSAFFSSSETVVTSTKSYKLRKYIDEGNRNAIIFNDLIENSAKTISAILIGNNIVNIIAPSISTLYFVSKFGARGVTYSTVVMTITLLIFGEIVPKTFASNNSLKYGLFVAPIIKFFVVILTPINIFFTALTKFFLKEDEGEKITEDDLIGILNEGHEEGIVESSEKNMIENVFDLTDSKASDIMTPRTSIVAVPIDISYDDLLDMVKDTHFSRLPVVGENIDDIVGLLYVKDLVGQKRESFDLKSILRPAYFQFESNSSYKLLTDLKKHKSTIAILVDEYGGTSGLVTIEDIVEEIVGDIDDEYDEVSTPLRRISKGQYSVKGDMDLEDVNDALGTNFTSEDYESIGGFVIGLAGKFPKRGEVYYADGYEFVVERAEGCTISRIRIRKQK